ncbi:unnamed protein product, partial [Rotaria sp. Silwood1]
MIAVPLNPNLIDIPLRKTRCCESGFDSTYPTRLNGIITADEFQQSMENINQTLSLRKFMKITILIGFLCLPTAVILIIGGGIINDTSSTEYSVIISIASGIFCLGILIILSISYIIRSQTIGKLPQVVANESMKYSTRSPPCSWRLNAHWIRKGTAGQRSSTLVCH